jgi:hypothetical protein
MLLDYPDEEPLDPILSDNGIPKHRCAVT